MSIRDALRVISAEKQIEELRQALDEVIQRVNLLAEKVGEHETAWREAARPRPVPMQQAPDARKQGRF